MHNKRFQHSGLRAAFGSVVMIWCSVAASQTDEGSSADPLLYEKGGLFETGLVAGLKLGGGFNQPFNAFGSSLVAELELGYNLPVMDRSLGLFVSGQYGQPATEASELEDTFGEDGSSRLPGTYSYSLQQTQAILTFGAIYRIRVPVDLFRPYVALGGRYYMMSTEVEGESDDRLFLSNTETGGALGFYGALGAELHVGPGAVLLELQGTAVTVDQFVLRDTNLSALNVALGYRLFL